MTSKEALEVASRILIMNQGEIVQDGTPMEIFDKPASHFIAQIRRGNQLHRHRSFRKGSGRFGALFDFLRQPILALEAKNPHLFPAQ